MRIRRLAQADNTLGFASGDPELDKFLQSSAKQNQFRKYIGTTYVAVDDEDAILGYVTVAVGSMDLEVLTAAQRKGLPAHYPLPILRLARLAVSLPGQGKGVGLALVRFVLDMALEQAQMAGCVGVVVDAKPAAVTFYKKLSFCEIQFVKGHSGSRPRPTPMFLGIKVIRKARGKR